MYTYNYCLAGFYISLFLERHKIFEGKFYKLHVCIVTVIDIGVSIEIGKHLKVKHEFI